MLRLFDIFQGIKSFFESQLETSQKWIMSFVSHEIKSAKILISFSISFLLISIALAVLAVALSWTSALWHQRKKVHLDVAPLEPVLDITPYKENPPAPTTKNGTPLKNFLPEAQEINVYDDDHLDTKLLPHFRPRKSSESDGTSNDAEAIRSLQMAQQMKNAGKQEKAMKLFQHALALNPLHPDILNNYGEFLEEEHHDFVKADHMYTRAIIMCPDHNKAVVNRKRTLPVVEDIDQRHLLRIDKKWDRLVKIPDHDPAFKRMKKEAYFQHIHHTVAIEGNTMTLAETRMVVETKMAVPGKSIIEHNEILGLESALKYINNTLVNKLGFITIEDILQIHKRVLGNVDPVQAGTLRQSQVYVGEHTPPSAFELYDYMEAFITWLNSETAQSMHPVKFAALAHYKLVYIHPFIDGNGRTARLLMNLILMRSGYPPVIIRKQDRSLYYDYLQLANEGDARPFIRFIAQCTERTLDVYLYATEYGLTSVKALAGQELPDVDNTAKVIES